MEMTDLFNNEGYIEPNKPTKFCRTCAHRQPWECGQRTNQYCGIRKSNRTNNGLLKIKVTNPACEVYKEGKNYWQEIKSNAGTMNNKKR